MLHLYEVRARRLRLGAALLLIFPGALLAPGALAQEASGASVLALSQDQRADQTAHLWRVGAWGAANALGGLALVALSDRESDAFRHAFGVQAAAWGVINTGIAVIGLATGPGEVSGDWATALGAENTYADILLVNLGLNVGYAAVGTTLLVAAGRGVSNPSAWRGHGAALILQGAGLFVLDGVAYLASRQRLGALTDIVDSASLTVGASGVRLVIGL